MNNENNEQQENKPDNVLDLVQFRIEKQLLERGILVKKNKLNQVKLLMRLNEK